MANNTIKLNDATMAVFKRKGYTIQRKLNEGSFGQVFKGTCTKTGADVAIKVMYIDKLGESYMKKFWEREKDALIEIRHQHVIEVYDIIRADGKLFIFMEFANGGDLAGYVKKNGAMLEPIACYWFTQASQAMAYMHDVVHMAHRDIKIDNVMLHNNRVKIADFGFARKVVDENGEIIMSNTHCGTMPYQCPQIIAQEMYNPCMADVWAMGVMLFCMLNNKYPFHWETPEIMYKEQVTEDFLKKRYIKTFPPDLMDLLAKFLEPDERKRITMAKSLGYPWILRKGKGKET